MLMTLNGVTPQVSPDAFIAETAMLIGNVAVGKDSSVWFGAVIRGDNEPITVGEGTSIQDNAVLHTEKGHPLTVGSNVTVGHGAIVHCTSVGDNTLVGMGAVLLDGAVIGRNCVVGAGAVVRENAVVPDGTMLVGVPANPIRQLTAEQCARMEEISPYVALSKEYMG